MEVIQWDSFWDVYEKEFNMESSLPGGALVEKALEDLRQRVIEHVSAKQFFIFASYFTYG